jgi:hypothetical protein
VRAPRLTRALGTAALLALPALTLAETSCSSTSSGNGCNPDQNGMNNEPVVVHLSVSDTAFTVGAADSGPGEPNITTENSSSVTLTVTNAGTRPHDFVVQCLATPNTLGCPTESCFPAGASIPPLAPGETKTVVFVTPPHEGSYTFVSDVAGDSALAGRFVLM